MRVVIEAVDHGSYDCDPWVCLSVWDGTRKLAELNVQEGDDQPYVATITVNRENVMLKQNRPGLVDT